MGRDTLKAVHRCGGGYFAEYGWDGRPQFRCSKCNEKWTNGYDGGEYLTACRNSKTDNGVKEKESK